MKADNNRETETVQLTGLGRPKSGWEPFWKTITDEGLLTLPDPSEIGCENRDGVDGTSYVVEINQDNLYRTYMYGGGLCPEVEQMYDIGDIIGSEFDSGREECGARWYPWFPCATLEKARKQTAQ